MSSGRHGSARPRSRLVEIAGVAGAGKSTLTRLISREPDVRIADFIHTRIPSHAARFARSVPRLLPVLAGTLGPGPRLSWPETKLMVYITEWDRFLGGRPEYQGGMTLLDQGPLYALVRLKAQGKNVVDHPRFERWWNEMLERWTRELSVVVWLDAPDSVLWERINGRGQRHVTKDGSRDAGLRFMARYRALFEDVLRRVDVDGGPEVWRFDTGERPAEDVAAEVEHRLRAGASPAPAPTGREPR